MGKSDRVDITQRRLSGGALLAGKALGESGAGAPPPCSVVRVPGLAVEDSSRRARLAAADR